MPNAYNPNNAFLIFRIPNNYNNGCNCSVAPKLNLVNGWNIDSRAIFIDHAFILFFSSFDVFSFLFFGTYKIFHYYNSTFATPMQGAGHATS